MRLEPFATLYISDRGVSNYDKAKKPPKTVCDGFFTVAEPDWQESVANPTMQRVYTELDHGKAIAVDCMLPTDLAFQLEREVTAISAECRGDWQFNSVFLHLGRFEFIVGNYPDARLLFDGEAGICIGGRGYVRDADRFLEEFLKIEFVQRAERALADVAEGGRVERIVGLME